jgi:hypothetical protein
VNIVAVLCCLENNEEKKVCVCSVQMWFFFSTVGWIYRCGIPGKGGLTTFCYRLFEIDMLGRYLNWKFGYQDLIQPPFKGLSNNLKGKFWLIQEKSLKPHASHWSHHKARQLLQPPLFHHKHWVHWLSPALNLSGRIFYKGKAFLFICIFSRAVSLKEDWHAVQESDLHEDTQRVA